jgi:hypothetical protein
MIDVYDVFHELLAAARSQPTLIDESFQIHQTKRRVKTIANQGNQSGSALSASVVANNSNHNGNQLNSPAASVRTTIQGDQAPSTRSTAANVSVHRSTGIGTRSLNVRKDRPTVMKSRKLVASSHDHIDLQSVQEEKEKGIDSEEESSSAKLTIQQLKSQQSIQTERMESPLTPAKVVNNDNHSLLSFDEIGMQQVQLMSPSGEQGLDYSDSLGSFSSSQSFAYSFDAFANMGSFDGSGITLNERVSAALASVQEQHPSLFVRKNRDVHT